MSQFLEIGSLVEIVRMGENGEEIETDQAEVICYYEGELHLELLNGTYLPGMPGIWRFFEGISRWRCLHYDMDGYTLCFSTRDSGCVIRPITSA